MKKYTAMNKIYTVLSLAAMPLLWTGCTLHQEPDGLGEDPTRVNVDVKLDLSLELPDSEEANEDIVPSVTDEFTRRFIVEACLTDGTVMDRQEFLEPVVDGQTAYTLPVKMRLNARQYRLLVWSDYVRTETPDENLYYDPESLTPVLPQGNYVGNNDRKDCFRACTDLDLREYASDWAVTVPLEVTLERPVGRYEIVSTDLGAFRKRLAEGLISGTDFKARVRYSDYRATGYNVLENVPKNLLSYLFFTTNLNAENWTEDQASLNLAFDYIFVNPGEEGPQIPLEIEIVNEKDVQVSRTLVTIPVRQGYNTVVSGRFMTGTDDGGIAIDPDFDGTVDIDLGKI